MNDQDIDAILNGARKHTTDVPLCLRTDLVAEYEDAIVNPWDAAERGYVDAVIRPSETRVQVVRALRALRTKRASLPPKKHGNIPL